MIFSKDPTLQERHPQISSWRKAEKGDAEAWFRKYDVDFKIPEMEESNWSTVQELDESWSKAETEYLLSLLEQFHGNFILVDDRFDRSRFGKARTIGRFWSGCGVVWVEDILEIGDLCFPIWFWNFWNIMIGILILRHIYL